MLQLPTARRAAQQQQHSSGMFKIEALLAPLATGAETLEAKAMGTGVRACIAPSATTCKARVPCADTSLTHHSLRVSTHPRQRRHRRPCRPQLRRRLRGRRRVRLGHQIQIPLLRADSGAKGWGQRAKPEMSQSCVLRRRGTWILASGVVRLSWHTANPAISLHEYPGDGKPLRFSSWRPKPDKTSVRGNKCTPFITTALAIWQTSTCALGTTNEVVGVLPLSSNSRNQQSRQERMRHPC